MSRTIKEAWTDYERYYAKGFAVVAKKDLPVYKQLTGSFVVATIKKGTQVTTKPVTGGYQSRVEVKEGWVNITALGKPGKNKIKMPSLKPQDFDIAFNTKQDFKKYYKDVIGAIMKRDGLPKPLEEYLVQLIKFCYEHKDKPELMEAFNTLKETEYIDAVSNIANDFSEIMAPLCVLERGAERLNKLGYRGLNKNNAQIYIPYQGNYPLLDFMIYDDKDVEYKFSVKRAGKTTNTVKPQDIIDLLNAKSNTKFVKEYKTTIPYQILKDLAEGSASLGPFKAFKTLVKGFPDRTVSTSILQIIDKMIPDGKVPDVELYQEQWTEIMGIYYNMGIEYWGNAPHSSGNVGIASLTCQMALEKVTKNQKLFNYRDIVEKFVMQEICFYKFDIKKGMPEFYLENHLYNRIKQSDTFYLRVKSSIGRPYRDKVGVQA